LKVVSARVSVHKSCGLDEAVDRQAECGIGPVLLVDLADRSVDDVGVPVEGGVIAAAHTGQCLGCDEEVVQLTVFPEVGDVVVQFLAGGAGGRDGLRSVDAPDDLDGCRARARGGEGILEDYRAHGALGSLPPNRLYYNERHFCQSSSWRL
jgi:hypothetical protein